MNQTYIEYAQKNRLCSTKACNVHHITVLLNEDNNFTSNHKDCRISCTGFSDFTFIEKKNAWQAYCDCQNYKITFYVDDLQNPEILYSSHWKDLYCDYEYHKIVYRLY